MESTNKKLSFEEMEKYAESLGCNFYNAMIGEVINMAITEEKQLSLEEIQDIAGYLCDSDELNELINGIILENF